ncbi:type III pantothenate kinase [Pseudalgibacter alginicilyticus]|uniref:Type III pantothenate kinase n=1 Tax=Pseudalgibacter alginicilyticus TaxID=1736674 RepID=A0A0P0CGF2_9FLAO|nr:type III pantothenate kinase [Pseudalgibacter alginicilyticus]ALJ05181.1 type III pantothenate kinase [Pseudalgibacter alginicilyticus]
MNLVVDVGNSFFKLAVFEGDTLEVKAVVESDVFLEEVDKLLYKFPVIEKAIVASVGKIKESDVNYLKNKLHVLFLNRETVLPFVNKYATPSTLGIDRMVLVSASIFQFSNKNKLIIDAGTCITYDFVTDKNEYLGGAISPGIQMRYKSLHNFTANLPLLETEEPESIIGNSTNSSIHSGVIYGVINEIEGVIDSYKHKFSDLTVILTGGDTNFLSKQLKSSIFANSNFLLEGLNAILQYNNNE